MSGGNYQRVPVAEETDEQVIELQVPTVETAAAESSRPMSPAPPCDSESEELLAEPTPMVNQEIEEEEQQQHQQPVAESSTSGGRTSLLNRIISRVYPQANPTGNDGVFSNLTAKPDTNADKDEQNPPPYEAAASDATPPYLDTTTLAPGLGHEMSIEGLPVGNFFTFVWNLLVSMSFQFVGFLLTYLLHTSHAAKNGSRAGLGVTLAQYGFYLRSRAMDDDDDGYYVYNGHSMLQNSKHHEWLSYVLMFLGWLIIVRSVADYIRVKRMETILQAPVPENV